MWNFVFFCLKTDHGCVFICLFACFFSWGDRICVATWEDLPSEEFIMGEEKFHEGGAGFSSIIKKKNNEKSNMKKFFQLKVRTSIKT